MKEGKQSFCYNVKDNVAFVPCQCTGPTVGPFKQTPPSEKDGESSRPGVIISFVFKQVKAEADPRGGRESSTPPEFLDPLFKATNLGRAK